MRTGRSLTRYRRSDARWDDLITLTAVCPYEGDLSGHIMKLVQEDLTWAVQVANKQLSPLDVARQGLGCFLERNPYRSCLSSRSLPVTSRDLT